MSKADEPAAADRDADKELLISVPKAAKRLDVSPRTVWKLIRDGRLPAKRIYRRTLVSVKELEAWVNADEKREADDDCSQ